LKPDCWDETYTSVAVWGFDTDTFFCPPEYETWLQDQPEFSQLELVEVETLKLEIE
jgi:hypothetical protein